jgi:hypothetical protein
VVKQTFPLTTVAASTLVNVLDTIPKVLFDPRLGLVCAAAPSIRASERSATNPRLAGERRWFRLNLRRVFPAPSTTRPIRTIAALTLFIAVSYVTHLSMGEIAGRKQVRNLLTNEMRTLFIILKAHLLWAFSNKVNKVPRRQ